MDVCHMNILCTRYSTRRARSFYTREARIWNPIILVYKSRFIASRSRLQCDKHILITLWWPVIFSLSRRHEYNLRRKMMHHAIGQVQCGAWFATVSVECVSSSACLAVMRDEMICCMVCACYGKLYIQRRLCDESEINFSLGGEMWISRLSFANQRVKSGMKWIVFCALLAKI